MSHYTNVKGMIWTTGYEGESESKTKHQ